MSKDIWTVRDALDWIRGYLERHEDANPRLSAEWLLSYSTGLSRTALYMDMDRPLSNAERDVLRDGVKRRSAGEPLQYITQSASFRYLTLKVKKGVLIPRPETEVLVSVALANIPKDVEDILVADICTGSGCIACSIATERKGCKVIATDISPCACELARENVGLLKLDDFVDVIECDLGDGIDTSFMGTFDVVISNPPYIPTYIANTMPKEVEDYEPSLALFGGDDGLDIFRRLIEFSKKALKPGGMLAVELFEDSLDLAAGIAEANGFSEIKIEKDLADKPRVLSAIWRA